MPGEKIAEKEKKLRERANAAKNKKGEALGIEESLKKLDTILEKMEDENTSLEETFKLYEEGLGIVKRVNAGIDKVEKRIRILNGGKISKEEVKKRCSDALSPEDESSLDEWSDILKKN